MVSRSLEVPLVGLGRLMGGDVGVVEGCVFAGCLFMPSFVLGSVLVLRVLLWTTTGDVRLVQISTTAAEEGKKVLVEVLASFAINDHTHPTTTTANGTGRRRTKRPNHYGRWRRRSTSPRIASPIDGRIRERSGVRANYLCCGWRPYSGR